ncbi:MAG TPA: hypothetical protein VLU25_19820 [Acidobacteriota bacterium]|nr:hypothetical protein [Acidobacteriota bacterium]
MSNRSSSGGDFDRRNLVEFERTDWKRAGLSHGRVTKRSHKSIHVKLLEGRGSKIFKPIGRQWVSQTPFSDARFVLRRMFDSKGKEIPLDSL